MTLPWPDVGIVTSQVQHFYHRSFVEQKSAVKLISKVTTNVDRLHDSLQLIDKLWHCQGCNLTHESF